MSDAELSFLAKTAADSNVVFEIGSFFGRSTRALGDNCKGRVYAIDPWEADNLDAKESGIAFRTSFETYNIFHCNLADLINEGKVSPERSTWQDWIPPHKADFTFIDGDHRYQSVLGDIHKALEWTSVVIAGHDYATNWHGVVRAVNEVFSDRKINVIDTIWWVNV